jgi:cation diffusion facilitator family transporter
MRHGEEQQPTEHGHGHAHGHGHDGHGHDGHAHGHGHPAHREGPRGWWSRAAHLLTPHSHDAADRMDGALRTSALGLRTVAWSFAILAVTALGQLAVVALTGSVALLGDTIHNLADALTAVPLAAAFWLGRRPASRRYTYGLGRSEDLAGVIVVLVIAASAVLAGYQAILRLLHPEPITHLWAVAVAGLVGFAGNELVARLRIGVGRRIGSAALVADGVHARTDGFTSLAVVAGALGVALGFPIADPLIGLAIAVMILLVARDAARDVLRRLMDAVDPAVLALAERTAAQVPGVRTTDQLRMRWIGHELHAELAAGVDPQLTVERAHRLAHEVEHALVHAVPRLAAAMVHVEPASRAAAAHDTLAHHR